VSWFDIWTLGFLTNLGATVFLIVVVLTSMFSTISSFHELARVNRRIGALVSPKTTKDRLISAARYLIPFFMFYKVLHDLCIFHTLGYRYELFMIHLTKKKGNK